MYKIGKSKMQVNMYRAVLILLLVVCWVQSQSVTSSLSPASASNSVTTNQSSSARTTARSKQEKSQSISSTKHQNYPSTTTKHENSPSTTTNLKNSPSTTASANLENDLSNAASNKHENSLSNTATVSTENKNSPNISTSNKNTKDHSISSTITTPATSILKPTTATTTPTSSSKITVATSNSTTNLTTAVATSTKPTNSTKTTITASTGTTNLTTTVATGITPTSSTKTTITASTGTTNLTTTVANGTTPKSSTKTTVTASTGTTNLTTTVATGTTPTSSTKTTITASTGTTNLTTTIATSTRPTSSTKTTATTTGTTHKIGLSTTGTATNGNPKLTTELKTSSRTQSPGTTKTTTPATSTVRVTSLGKIYISEVMVGRDDVLIQVELFVTAEVNISHYTLAVFDDTQNMVQSSQLNPQLLHDGFLTVSLNNTMEFMHSHGFKTNSVGIALYDASLWINKTLNNTAGLVDALVIGTSFQTTSARLVQVLTPGCLPIVLQQSQTSENKSITRCSEERACDSSMFIYTSASFGKNNSAICENRWKNMDTITLKFNCSCQTCDNTSINEIIHFLIQEIDKNCQCEVTALNIMDSYVACCGGTALHATIVAADREQKDKMMKAYETLLHSTTTVTLGHNNYTISKKCGSFCCHQTVLSTDSSKSSTDSSKSSRDSSKSSTDSSKSFTYSSKSSTDSSKTELKTEANIKLRVAVTVTCIMVFLIIIIIVVLYRRRKKRGVHQFSMIRLNEEDEDLIMDGVENDNVVGGQEATFYKNRLGS